MRWKEEVSSERVRVVPLFPGELVDFDAVFKQKIAVAR